MEEDSFALYYISWCRSSRQKVNVLSKARPPERLRAMRLEIVMQMRRINTFVLPKHLDHCLRVPILTVAS